LSHFLEPLGLEGGKGLARLDFEGLDLGPIDHNLALKLNVLLLLKGKCAGKLTFEELVVGYKLGVSRLEPSVLQLQSRIIF
jgi:hypothetical protein